MRPNTKDKRKIPMLFLLTACACLAGCGLREVPQVDTVYSEAPYPSQVGKETRMELKARYPKDFQKTGSPSVPMENRLRVGIREFFSPAGPPETGKMVTEIVTTVFVQSDAFILVERQQLDKVLNEIELNQSGVVDEAGDMETGGISGLDVLVTGGISQIGNEQRVDARVIDVKTGQIVLAETLTPAPGNNPNANGQPLDTGRISDLAWRLVDELARRYYP